MKLKTIAACLLLLICLSSGYIFAASKDIIGETAWITVEGVPHKYLSRIDTGARKTSIHAIDIQVTDGSEKLSDNVGKGITFTSIDGEGKSQKFSTTIIKVSTVKNSQGVEQRYVVELVLGWKDVTKKVEVNLRDRSAMQYKLLIGRNWLSSDFLVDVDRKADPKGMAD